jgi:5-methylcytosine-specific restriction endonuclease McrA
MAKWEENFLTKPRPCPGCQQVTSSDKLFNLEEEGLNFLGEYCATCADEIRAIYTRTCWFCGNSYYASKSNRRSSLCPSCKSMPNAKFLIHEISRLNDQLKRAEKAGLPATLSLRQWVATIEHFKGLCAYCQNKPFEVLEHFVPVEMGGGTTASNCVPACNKCNAIKGGFSPHEPAVLTTGIHLHLVKIYLEEQDVSQRHGLAAAQEALGHVNQRNTRIYTGRLAGTRDRYSSELLDDYLGE